MLVTNEMAVLNASAGVIPLCPQGSGKSCLCQQQPVQEQDADRREGQQREAVIRPPLPIVGLRADQAVDHPLHAPVPGVGIHPGHVVAQGNMKDDDEQDDRHDRSQAAVAQCRGSLMADSFVNRPVEPKAMPNSAFDRRLRNQYGESAHVDATLIRPTL